MLQVDDLIIAACRSCRKQQADIAHSVGRGDYPRTRIVNPFKKLRSS